MMSDAEDPDSDGDGDGILDSAEGTDSVPTPAPTPRPTPAPTPRPAPTPVQREWLNYIYLATRVNTSRQRVTASPLAGSGGECAPRGVTKVNASLGSGSV